MPSFGVKNILRKGIATYVFFNTSEDIVDYLTIKCPQFNYTHLPSEDVWYAMIIKECMKQHLMIFAPNEPVFCKEYPCSCNACLWFDFKECSGDDILVYAELPCNDYSGDDEEVDAIDKTEHIFDFLDVPSFVSLFSGNQNETLYFVKATEKGTAQKDITDPYGLFIGNDEKFLNFWFKKLILICSFLLIAISIVSGIFHAQRLLNLTKRNLLNKQVAKLLTSSKIFMKYNFSLKFSLKFERFWYYFHKFLCILIWNILILLLPSSK